MTASVVTFLANAAWQPLLLAPLAWLAGRRARASIRCWIAVAALAGCVAMPLVSTLARPGGGGAAVSVAPDLDARTALVITSIYVAFVLVAAIRLVRRWRAAARLTPDAIATPVTAGVLRPRVLMPRFLTDPDLVAAAVAHEQAHIRRRDPLVALLVEIAAVPLAFHPAIVLLRRRIAELREIACDEAAADDRPAYARALVAIAALATRHAPAGALAMAATSLERRVASLRAVPRRGGAAAAIVFAVAATLLFAAGCRYASRPSVGTNLSGDWTLDRAASDLGPLRAYSRFEQSIAHSGDAIAVAQTRVGARGVERVAWSVTADGVERVTPRGRGRARWDDGRLVVELRSNGHLERAVAAVERASLVVEGEVRSGSAASRYRAVFRRSR